MSVHSGSDADTSSTLPLENEPPIPPDRNADGMPVLSLKRTRRNIGRGGNRDTLNTHSHNRHVRNDDRSGYSGSSSYSGSWDFGSEFFFDTSSPHSPHVFMSPHHHHHHHQQQHHMNAHVSSMFVPHGYSNGAVPLQHQHVLATPSAWNHGHWAPSPLFTVHVRDVPSEVTEHQLAQAFASCGPVVECRMCGDPNSASHRFAFVAFPTQQAANTALTLSGMSLGGGVVKILQSKTPVIPVNPMLLPQTEEELEMCSRTVYVANVAREATEDVLRDFFEQLCGGVARIHVLCNIHSAHNSCVAFVEFITSAAAATALSCSGRAICGRPIRVSPSKTPLRVSADHNVERERALRNAPDTFAFTSPALAAPWYPGGFSNALAASRRNGNNAAAAAWGMMGARRNTMASNALNPRMWHTVHVRNISHLVSESALAEVFACCGRVLDCRLSFEKASSSRFAFVAFSSSAEVEAALSLNKTTVCGHQIRVVRSKTAVIPVDPTRLPRSLEEIEKCERTVYVTNLDPSARTREVEAAFAGACGAVSRIHLQSNSRRDTAVAFIEFVEAHSAALALTIVGNIVGQLPVRVSPSKTPLKATTKERRVSSRFCEARNGIAMGTDEDAHVTTGDEAKSATMTDCDTESNGGDGAADVEYAMRSLHVSIASNGSTETTETVELDSGSEE